MLPFHITRKVAIRHKKRREAICFMVERIAIIYIESEVQTMRTEKKELNVQIGKRLQTVRENSGYTQKAFAEALDIGVEHYRKIELGMYGLQRENMLILYKKYKIDPAYLLGWFSYLDISANDREIGILVIKKEYLHCGYGAQCLLWFIEKCKEDNVEKIILNVNQSNARAIQFYKKFGFEIFAEEIIPQCNEAIDLAQYKMQLYVK